MYKRATSSFLTRPSFHKTENNVAIFQGFKGFW